MEWGPGGKGLLRHSPLPRAVNYNETKNENENKNKDRDGDKTVARQRRLLSNKIDKVSRLSRSLPTLSPPAFLSPLSSFFPFTGASAFTFSAGRCARSASVQFKSAVYGCVWVLECVRECVLLIVFHLTVKLYRYAPLCFFPVMACIKGKSFAAQLSFHFDFHTARMWGC